MITELVGIITGVLAGIVTGLIPGVHVNLVATIALALGVSISAAPFLVALSVTHSILSTIPAILLGAPESATALGVLPGHRYMLQGNGYMAIKLTVIGSYFGLLVAAVLTPIWLIIIQLYAYIVPILGYVLLLISAYMILRDNKSVWACSVYVLSGVLGWVLFSRPILTEPLFPMLTGLFGTSTLLYSLTQTSSVPAQKISPTISLRKKDTTKAILAGNVSGFLTSMLPGLGSAQAAILGMNISGRIGDHGFLVMIGTISTVNFVLSLLTWLILDKARNGAIVAIASLGEVSLALVLLLVCVAFVSASIAVWLSLVLSRTAIRGLSYVSYTKITWGVIVLLVILVIVLTGVVGLYVLLLATAIGLIPAIVRCGRAHAMGCLLLPVAFYFL